MCGWGVHNLQRVIKIFTYVFPLPKKEKSIHMLTRYPLLAVYTRIV